MIENFPIFRSRIAPTPSGYLHTGNALNFVLTWLLIRYHKGELFLRIDDLDTPRIKPQYIEDIFRTLDWLGIDIDKGPSGPDDLSQNYSQRFRLSHYQETLDLLKKTDSNIFPCTCSRTQIRENSLDGQYPGTCRKLSLDPLLPNTALRITTPSDLIISWDDHWQEKVLMNLSKTMRDFVVRRKDGVPAYQIASLTDDIENGINLIVRGADLQDSTAAQLFLAECLDNQSFQNTRFYHHSLIYKEDGSKLSKSHGATGLNTLYTVGDSPKEIYQLVARHLGLIDSKANSIGDLFTQAVDGQIFEQ